MHAKRRFLRSNDDRLSDEQLRDEGELDGRLPAVTLDTAGGPRPILCQLLGGGGGGGAGRICCCMDCNDELEDLCWIAEG